MNAPDYFTCGEAATATGMSAQGLRAAIRRGDVAAEWHGSRWLLTPATVEQLTGAQRAADHTEEPRMTQLNGNTNQQPFEMGEDDLEKVRAMWNDVVVGASRDECEAADILVTLDADSPDIARVEIPAMNESGREHRCLISLLSHGGTWRPLAPIHPGEIDQAVLNVSAGIDAVLENVDTMSVEAVRALLGEVNAKTMALANSLDDRNPRSTHPGWQPIPDDEQILAFWSQIPSDECLPS